MYVHDMGVLWHIYFLLLHHFRLTFSFQVRTVACVSCVPGPRLFLPNVSPTSPSEYPDIVTVGQRLDAASVFGWN